MSRTVMADVERFLNAERIAVVGVSRDPRDFSRVLLRELGSRGYDAVPVNPAAEGPIEGRTCFPTVSAIVEPVEAALIMTPPDRSREVVDDCAAAGVDLVWLHRGAGQGAVSEDAVAATVRHGMTAVVGQCPFMFLPKSGAIHAVHRFFKKLGRSYPRAA